MRNKNIEINNEDHSVFDFPIQSENQFMSGPTIEPEELAARLQLKPKRANGKREWHGPNPFEAGAGDDGFILNEDGTAWDRKLRRRYTSHHVALSAGIKPTDYGPCARWMADSPFRSSFSFNSLNSSNPGTKYSDAPTSSDDIVYRPSRPARATTRTTACAEERPHPVDGCAPKPNSHIIDNGLSGACNTYDQSWPSLEIVPPGLDSRLIGIEAVRLFGITWDGKGFRYPTYHANLERGRDRWKNATPQGNPKYRWCKNHSLPESPANKMPPCYGLQTIKRENTFYVTGGEVDTWTARQTGFNAVSPFGEGNPYDGMMCTMKELQFSKAIIVLDNDDVGHRGSFLAFEAARNAGLECEVRDIGGPPKNDWNALYQKCGGDNEDFRAQILNLPVVSPEQIAIWGEPLTPVSNCASTTPPYTPGHENNEFNEINPPAHISADDFHFRTPEAALHGVAGDLVRMIEPETEAHPMAILIQFLALFGNLVGNSPHFMVERTKHTLRIFTVLVGQSAKGRKGTSWNIVRDLVSGLDDDWANNITSGLTSGEGAVFQVRDPIFSREKTKNDLGETVYEDVIKDPGVEDKRLVIVEEEFAQVLRVVEREGNTLSPVVRKLWDDGTYRFLNKNCSNSTTDCHVTIMGHIVREELKKLLSTTEASNGFANRFLWILVRRTKLLPEGGNLNEQALQYLKGRVGEAAAFGMEVGEMKRNDTARELWAELYQQLASEKQGLTGIILGRGEAQVMRLACIYAVLDQSAVVKREHLAAAWAVWQYAEDSVVHLFSSKTGNRIADSLLPHLMAAGSAGLNATQCHEVLGRNFKAIQVREALDVLVRSGAVQQNRGIGSGGRAVDTWHWMPQNGNNQRN